MGNYFDYIYMVVCIICRHLNRHQQLLIALMPSSSTMVPIYISILRKLYCGFDYNCILRPDHFNACVMFLDRCLEAVVCLMSTLMYTFTYQLHTDKHSARTKAVQSSSNR